MKKQRERKNPQRKSAELLDLAKKSNTVVGKQWNYYLRDRLKKELRTKARMI